MTEWLSEPDACTMTDLSVVQRGARMTGHLQCEDAIRFLMDRWSPKCGWLDAQDCDEHQSCEDADVVFAALVAIGPKSEGVP